MIEAGAAYDYYRGAPINADWKMNIIKPRLDGGINPSNRGLIIFIFQSALIDAPR